MTDPQRTTPGVALFDDQYTRSSGWACFAHENAFSISNPQSLSSAGIWLTNLESGEFFDSGLSKSNRFRMLDYLRTRLSTIGAELGITVEENGRQRVTGPECAQALARLFGHVMDVAARMGVSSFPPHQLRIGFRGMHYKPAGQPALAAAHQDAMRGAIQRHTSSASRLAGRGHRVAERTVHLTRHRYQHAWDMVTQQVPYGSWRVMPRMSAHELLNTPLPLLYEVEVQNADPRIGALINFGGSTATQYRSGAGYQVDASPRRWLTQPEFSFLSNYATIAVLQVLGAEAYQDNPLAKHFPVLGQAQQLSPAFLLAMESFWTSAYREVSGKSDFSPIAAWMSSYDRIACLTDAIRLIDKDPDIDVTQMGYGRITCKIVEPGRNLGAWLGSIVKDTYLIPPVALTGPGHFPIDPETATPTQILQAISISGDPHLLAELDPLAIESWDQDMAADAEAASG